MQGKFLWPAPAMEPGRAARMFTSSVPEYKICDKQKFMAMMTVRVSVKRIGHVQKRVETALRKLNKDNPDWEVKVN